MNRATREAVRTRAGDRCEYCRLPQRLTPFASFHVEHIFAQQHKDDDDLANLAWSCHRCNLNKGPNLSGIDGESGRVVRLFDPRRQRWNRHFGWRGSILVGLTQTGRATIAVLKINHPERVKLRQYLIKCGEFHID